MKEYNVPNMEIQKFNTDDVIVTSGLIDGGTGSESGGGIIIGG